ncbi:Dihydrolipoyllysine-residue succinyltransferase component of 2-oxoglutarate dehydrogenase complex [Lacunisphaera limnophila]|uniref:Dihydrolipoyllysine-residue succinyltransferase component of 2-oxoglutarate dehydrogenase complex n=1 Tax=Lacunisphaera limnophila TaxID=1838286 RepID=A0A1D8AWL2_9BACT|nr:2-oxoglutarate dehydrogenase complex dihydrolipoyllysine-residue succinyltransferase [Lacunisphaera limnophila]AOS45278.1 Dihydrolipoyllysine-residue succinyltransferase component of 2-oxoglutarate dehydrogenase complex [Lacunisphaera limnophila]
MAIEVKIPPMGESITSGVLAKWHVQNGDIVKKDQPLFELETDKITSEGTAEAAGRISFSLTAGTDVKIGQVVATIDPAATAAASTVAKPQDEPRRSPEGEGGSPAVRRLAAETGIDPANITGTGKAGRVTKGDMLAASPAPAGATATPPPSASIGGGVPSPREAQTAKSVAPVGASSLATSARQTRTKMSKLRQTIAARLVQAQSQAAMLTTFNEVDMSAVMELRKKYQDDFTKRHGVKLGFMSFFTKAVVQALKDVPGINAQIDGDEIVQNHYYDIGMAVSTDKGLMVPVIKGCESLDMAAIEKAIGEAAKKARDGKITLADLEGGVFTITNGGIFGSMLSTPILNAPQSAILGLHAINERPVAVNGQVVIRPMMYLALSYDHRLVDGKQAVTFLVKVKQLIEDPARLAIGI